MTLHIGFEYGDLTNVWAENVPEDWTDRDVRAACAELAAAGDSIAKQALASCEYFLDHCWPRRADGTRVYLDR